MIAPNIPANENKRLLALKEYNILDTPPEQEYDDFTYLASHICKTPISLISLLDDKRQWFKSHFGLAVTETPKEVAFCAHAINDKDNIFVIPDSRKDERFHDNPLVTSEPHVIFYAGVPLVNHEGYPLGTLCVIDNKPNTLDDFQVLALKALSKQLINLIELRKTTRELKSTIFELESQNQGLEKFARTAAHDLKSPLSSIVMLSNMFKDSYSEKIDAEGISLIDYINTSSRSLIALIEGILQYSRNSKLLAENREEVNLHKFITDLVDSIDIKKEAKYIFELKEDLTFFTNKTALQQIIGNLVGNSIKYNDKPQIIITIKAVKENNRLKINVLDNGPGIAIEDQRRVFQIFETASHADRQGKFGTGIGLATVKYLVEGLGGTISLYSEKGRGSNFEMSFINKI